jgi:hypothetical protein
MRVRVSLDFDILIESFISLCIMETVGAIFVKINRGFLPFIVRKRQRRSQLSHLIGYIKRHLKLWVCLTLQCTVLWMVRGLVSQIDPKKHIICAVILVNPCFIHVPCFPKRFDLSQIITPIINTKHLIVQNSPIITYFFISISKFNES